MNTKNVVLVALIMVNLLLLSALLLNVTAPRQAQAQVRGGAADYLVITAKLVQGGEDALWVLDLKTRRINALRYPQNGKDMVLIGSRSLEKDLRNKDKEK